MKTLSPAAQTIYPILNRNYADLGLSIAVLPSAVTVASMKATRGMGVVGLQPRRADCAHQAASVSMTAEAYCLDCHVKAKVGEVLGTVSVRSYLERKAAAWCQEVRLTGAALSLKILAHTILLFLLMKVSMEPLLALRSTVSGLAKGAMDLWPRAGVKSADEFGELAEDLNHFLDRIALIVRDLDKILSEVVVVGSRLGAMNKHLERQLDGLRDESLRALGAGAQRSQEAQLLAVRESGAFDARMQALGDMLDALAATGPVSAAADPQLREQLARLQAGFGALAGALQGAAPTVALAEARSTEYQAFAQSLRDMALLEVSMQQVAESCQQMLHRLTQE